MERPVIALAPNGRSIVYNTTQGLYLRSMDDLEARLIAGTEANLSTPFFSPDGEWVGFWEPAGGQLKRVPVAGGTPVLIASGLEYPIGASWDPDGTILVDQSAGILRVPATDGTPELVVKRSEGEQGIYGPQLLPDADSVSSL